MFSNLRIFRDPIKPLWEVPQNREGGKFVLILNKTETGVSGASSGQQHSTAPPSASCSASQDDSTICSSSVSVSSGVEKALGSPSSSASHGTASTSTTANTQPMHSSHDSDGSEGEVSQNQQSSKSGTTNEKLSAEVPLEYKLCLSLMVLGLLGPVDQFCGCVLSIRAFGHMISIWISSSTDDSLVSEIRSNIALLLGVPLESISFQRHNESIRNNTRNLSKTEIRKKMREARAKGDEPAQTHPHPHQLAQPQQQRPPRRKSESEKPAAWVGAAAAAMKNTGATESHSDHATAPASAHGAPHAHSQQQHQQQQHQHDQRRQGGISRSLSGGRLNTSGASSASGTPQRGNSSQHLHSGSYKSPTSPRGNQQQAQGHQQSSTESQSSVTPLRLDAAHTDPSKAGKNVKRGPVSPRSAAAAGVTFRDTVSVQTYTPGAKTRPSAVATQLMNIPDINILTGTPPSTASPLALASHNPFGVISDSRGEGVHYDDDGEDSEAGWIPAGSSKAATTSSASALTHGVSAASTASKGTGAQLGTGQKVSKRRSQSASGGPNGKPDPNYVSPEALFGADLPLLSPGSTPYTSVPPSPPPELDEEDLAFLEEQRKLRQTEQEALSSKLEQLSSTEPPATQASSTGNGNPRRRSRNNKRRKSTTDSETTPYPSSVAPQQQH